MSNKKGAIILWLGAIVLTIFSFWDIILQPNQSIIGAGGDGIKNYFTYLYYIGKDSGTHFSGMNYPFGEHIVFTDNMPIIAGAIVYLEQWIPNIGHYSLAIMHLLLLSSISVGAWYIYKILRVYNRNALWNAISAIFIAFFSPQIFKIFGHYGMGFCFYIPFVIYQLIKYQKKQSWIYPTAIFIVSLLLAFVHLYNLALIAILVGFYSLAYLITEKSISLKRRALFVLPLLFAVGSCFVLVKVFLKQTDNILDRTDYPHGVLGYEARGKDLFVTDTPLGHIFQVFAGKANGIAESEGKAYLGIVSIVVCFILLFRLGKSLKKKYKDNYIAQPIKGYNIWLWVAFFHLLFAMGIPAVWIRDWVADYISIFRQFRTLGRFIWPFYYIIMMYAALYIYHAAQLIKASNKAKWSNVLLATVVAIWGIQLSGYVINSRIIAKQSIDNYNNLFETPQTDWNQWLKDKGHAAKDFQASMVLPFFHIGSEKLWLMDVGEHNSSYELFKNALHTQLPIINVMMSRTSWSQTFEMVKIMDGPFTEKKYFDRLNNSPILLLVNEELPLKSKEKQWVEQATFIGKRHDFLSVYSIDVNKLKKYEDSLKASTKAYIANTSTVEGLINDSASFYYVNHFDNAKNENAFIGEGAFNAVKTSDFVILDSINIPANLTDSFYNLSMWVKCNMIDYRSPYFEIYQYNDKGEQIGFVDVSTKYSTHIIKDWFLVEKDLKLENAIRKIIIKISKNRSRRDYYAIDELVLKPVDKTYFNKAASFNGSKSTIFINNRPQL